MIYKDFKGLQLPLLGVGLMRLPVIDGDDNRIDEEETERMFAYAMEHGVNYFDTAWGYHGGNSETVSARILSKYPRESYYLADKFPSYDPSNMNKAEEIFEAQLKKCNVDYFDFYLLHNLCELNIDAYLDDSYGVVPYFLKQRDAGRIKHLGFSTHGYYETNKRFLEAYGEHMEMGQLQVNWLDWKFMDMQKMTEMLHSFDVPLWVMEPLRGGKLAHLAPEDEAKLKALRPDESIPGWAFRFLQTIPNVSMVLSGMSNLEQLKQNIATFEDDKPLSAHEMEVLDDIATGMMNQTALPCTACKYCMSYCPQELDIPYLLELYNQRCLTGERDFIAEMGLASLAKDKQPGDCIACGACEEVCPQKLKISDAMHDFDRMMN